MNKSSLLLSGIMLCGVAMADPPATPATKPGAAAKPGTAATQPTGPAAAKPGTAATPPAAAAKAASPTAPAESASPSNFGELVNINAETKLTEAKIKLAEAKNKLRQAGGADAALGSRSAAVTVVDAAGTMRIPDPVLVQSVMVGMGEAMAVVKAPSGNTLTVRVGDEIPGVGLVTAIDKHLGVKVGGQYLPFDLGDIKKDPNVSGSSAQSLPVIR